jgi:hypothetical protein
MTELPMSASLDNLVYLSSGDWESYVLPAFGANVIRLACQGREILRTPPDLVRPGGYAGRFRPADPAAAQPDGGRPIQLRWPDLAAAAQ